MNQSGLIKLLKSNSERNERGLGGGFLVPLGMGNMLYCGVNQPRAYNSVREHERNIAAKNLHMAEECFESGHVWAAISFLGIDAKSDWGEMPSWMAERE